MSTSAIFRVETRPYSGYAEPAFPIASWIAQGSIIGNATGGSATIVLQISAGEATPVSEMYNLEQLHVDTQAPVTEQIIMATQFMDNLAPNRPAAEQSWVIPLTTTGANDSVMALIQNAGLPIWLGAPLAVFGAGVSSALTFEWQNVNLQASEVTAQGYIWGPRSVLAPGGPQRPPFGLFR